MQISEHWIRNCIIPELITISIFSHPLYRFWTWRSYFTNSRTTSASVMRPPTPRARVTPAGGSSVARSTCPRQRRPSLTGCWFWSEQQQFSFSSQWFESNSQTKKQERLYKHRNWRPVILDWLYKGSIRIKYIFYGIWPKHYNPKDWTSNSLILPPNTVVMILCIQENWISYAGSNN